LAFNKTYRKNRAWMRGFNLPPGKEKAKIPT
jgi:hypothetical protein